MKYDATICVLTTYYNMDNRLKYGVKNYAKLLRITYYTQNRQMYRDRECIRGFLGLEGNQE